MIKKAAHTFLLGLFTPTGEGRSLKMKLIAYFVVIVGQDE
jgi:hypothetical protein